jgi:hypothetical protein
MQRSKLLKRLLGQALMVAVASLTHVAAASALVIHVNDSGSAPDFAIDGVCETAPGNGICTLTAALDEINAAAGPAMHFVFIDERTIGGADSCCSYTVRPGVHVTIWGAGAGRTIIDKASAFGGRIMTVSEAATLVVRGVSLINARDGEFAGALDNAGFTSLVDTRFTNNLATLLRPSGNGGAIYNRPSGRLIIIASTLDYNGARAAGGALRNDGWLSVFNSTFDHNIAFGGVGGAIFNNGTAYVTASTFSANDGIGGGAITNWGTATAVISNATFAGNETVSSPGMTLNNAAGATMQVVNSILVATAPANCEGVIESFGFNLVNDNSCGFVGPGDMQNVDPNLGPLGNNGGPTETHAPWPGSAAIDQGWCWLGIDQRGFPRPVNLPRVPNARNGCDIGAVEVQPGDHR